MENTEISNHTELVMRIMHLKQEKFRQEEELKYSIREIGYNLNPATLAKNYIHELAENGELKFDIAKVGLNLAVNLIITRIMGKNRGVKGFLGALLVKTFSSSINNNLSSIVSGISRLIRRRSEHLPIS